MLPWGQLALLEALPPLAPGKRARILFGGWRSWRMRLAWQQLDRQRREETGCWRGPCPAYTSGQCQALELISMVGQSLGGEEQVTSSALCYCVWRPCLSGPW